MYNIVCKWGEPHCYDAMCIERRCRLILGIVVYCIVCIVEGFLLHYLDWRGYHFWQLGRTSRESRWRRNWHQHHQNGRRNLFRHPHWCCQGMLLCINGQCNAIDAVKVCNYVSMVNALPLMLSRYVTMYQWSIQCHSSCAVMVWLNGQCDTIDAVLNDRCNQCWHRYCLSMA